jgi:transcriptional regulator with XRE-family HTH domain
MNRPEKLTLRPQATRAAKRGNRSAEESDMELRIGTRLRHARLTLGARLRDVAEKAGCSESLISKLENDRIVPSLKVLHRLCEVLNLTLGELMSRPEPEEKKIWRRHERPVITLDPATSGKGIQLEQLVPCSRGHLLQGSIHVIAPGGCTRGSIAHEGEEVGYVLSGELELTLGEEVFHLEAGDSFIYRSELPHGYRNCGETEARVLWVNTPPSF